MADAARKPPPTKHVRLNDTTEDFSIQVVMPVGYNRAGSRVLFRRSEIAKLQESAIAGISIIRLKSGEDVPVRMDLDALHDRLYGGFFASRNEPFLDLSEETKGTLPPMEPGQVVAHHGVYVGRWQPKDLGQVFHVFAAPKDLPTSMTYVGAVAYIVALKGWYGYDGTPHTNEQEIHQALQNGSYNGGWIIPPCEILRGKDANGQEVVADNIFSTLKKGAFADVSKLEDGWYWSSTECPYDATRAGNTLTTDRNRMDWDQKNQASYRCRPVRLVPTV